MMDFNYYLVSFIKHAAFAASMILLGWWLNSVINRLAGFIALRFEQKQGMSPAIIRMLRTLCKIIVAAILFLFVLDNLNFQVSAFLTGLGIGGIAVALAVQNILQDLFASFSILIDKPFLMGDKITVDGYTGIVEYIGIKTTRIRSLIGEEIIFSNADLLKCRLRNYKTMRERRSTFTIQVVYETPLEKIQEIPSIIKDVIVKLHNIRFGRAHLKSLGAYSLDFEVVYTVLSAEDSVYMDIQQTINFNLIEEFQKHNIEFAYPTTKSIIEKEKKEELDNLLLNR